jgi:nicotinamidase/pyrazinamidase
MVDLQNDFLPGGALAVPGGDAVVAIANRLQTHFELVIATQDWHPANHVSFAANHPGKKVGDAIEVAGRRQLLWPVHCVEDTPGAALAADLDTSRIAHFVKKGADPLIDSYSAFFDNGHVRNTGLADYLRDQHVNMVYVMGLATDYCVKFTALDAVELGIQVVVIKDACRGVDVSPGDADRAMEEMFAAGVEIIESGAVIARNC